MSTFLLCWMSTERTDTTSCKEGKVMSIVSIVSILRNIQLKISTMQVDTDEVTAIKTMLTRSDTVLKLSFSQCWLYHWQNSNLNKVPDRSHSLAQRWFLGWTWMLLRSSSHNKESSSFLPCRWRFSLSLSFSLSLHRPSVCLNFSRFRDISQEHLVQFKPN